MRLRNYLAAGLVLASLTACNGDDSGTTTTQAASGLRAEAVYQPSLLQLDADWSGRVTAQAPDRLAFPGDPGLVIGDVFLLDGTAYKVAAVGGSAAATEITYVEPDLSDIYVSLTISGVAEITPGSLIVEEPAVAGASAAALVAEGSDVPVAAAAAAPLVGWSVSAGQTVDGLATAVLTGRTFLSQGVLLSGSLTLGSKFIADDWSPITGEGSAQLEVMIKPQAMLSLKDITEPTQNPLPSPEAVCSASGDASTEGRFRAAVVSFPVSAVTGLKLNVPLCISWGLEASSSLDLLELTHTYRATLHLGNRTRSYVMHNSTSETAVPAPSAQFMNSQRIAPSIGTSVSRMELAASGEVALEASLELNAWNMLRTGAMLQTGAAVTLTGSFPYSALRHPIANYLNAAALCAGVEAELFARPKLIGSIGWNKPSVALTGSLVDLTRPLLNERYGGCLCPDNSPLPEDGACPPIEASFDSTETITALTADPTLHAVAGGDNVSLYCDAGRAVGDSDHFAMTWKLDAANRVVALLDEGGGVDEGIYNPVTGEFSLDIAVPLEETTPAGATARYFTRGNYTFSGHYDVQTQTLTGTMTDTVIGSWDVDAREVQCITTSTYTGVMSAADKAR